jgi:hypothetical protein
MQLHTAPCLRALDLGYDVLLEKPDRPHRGRVPRHPGQGAGHRAAWSGVCHVLRYTPYFREVKALLDQGLIGEVVSVQHLEPIEHVHMSALLCARPLAQQHARPRPSSWPRAATTPTSSAGWWATMPTTCTASAT